MTPIVFIALAAAGLLALIWMLYPVTTVVLARARDRDLPHADTPQSVSAVIPTRDDPRIVKDRVENLMASENVTIDEVIIVVDHNAPGGVEPYRQVLDDSVVVMRGNAPGGKAASLNTGVAAARNEWIVLADSWQTFRPDTVARLLEATENGTYSAVSGRVAFAHEDVVMRQYWKFETALREAQSALHSVVTTSGAVCVMKRDSWPGLPDGLICDDLYLTMSLVRAGQRVGYCAGAVADDRRQYTKRQSFQKKVRTLTGLWQLMLWSPSVLVPWKNPIWIHFVLHKLARLITPYLALLLIGIVVLVTAGAVTPTALLWLAGIFLGASVIRPRVMFGAWRAATWGFWLLLAPVLATLNGVRANWQVWSHQQPARHR